MTARRASRSSQTPASHPSVGAVSGDHSGVSVLIAWSDSRSQRQTGKIIPFDERNNPEFTGCIDRDA
jgi:hypothetical protein